MIESHDRRAYATLWGDPSDIVVMHRCDVALLSVRASPDEGLINDDREQLVERRGSLLLFVQLYRLTLRPPLSGFRGKLRFGSARTSPTSLRTPHPKP